MIKSGTGFSLVVLCSAPQRRSLIKNDRSVNLMPTRYRMDYRTRAVRWPRPVTSSVKQETRSPNRIVSRFVANTHSSPSYTFPCFRELCRNEAAAPRSALKDRGPTRSVTNNNLCAAPWNWKVIIPHCSAESVVQCHTTRRPPAAMPRDPPSLPVTSRATPDACYPTNALCQLLLESPRRT